MKFPFLLAALSALTLGSCVLFYSRSGTPFGPNDYAIALAQPYPSEALLAQKRLHNFLARAIDRLWKKHRSLPSRRMSSPQVKCHGLRTSLASQKFEPSGIMQTILRNG